MKRLAQKATWNCFLSVSFLSSMHSITDITLLTEDIEEKSFHIVVTNKFVQHESHNKDRMMTFSSELTCYIRPQVA